MSERKYTAQEMHEYADAMTGDFNDNDYKSVEVTYDAGIVIIECLRQAADAIERYEFMKSRLEASIRRYDVAFNAQFAMIRHPWLTEEMRDKLMNEKGADNGK